MPGRARRNPAIPAANRHFAGHAVAVSDGPAALRRYRERRIRRGGNRCTRPVPRRRAIARAGIRRNRRENGAERKQQTSINHQARRSQPRRVGFGVEFANLDPVPIKQSVIGMV